jgi:hypothetical protein
VLLEALSVHKRLKKLVSLLCEDAKNSYINKKNIHLALATDEDRYCVLNGARVLESLNTYNIKRHTASRQSRHCLKLISNYVVSSVIACRDNSVTTSVMPSHLNVGQIYYFYWNTSKYYYTTMLNESLISVKAS